MRVPYFSRWFSSCSLHARVMWLATAILSTAFLISVYVGLSISSREALDQLHRQSQLKLGLITDSILGWVELHDNERLRQALQKRMDNDDLNFLAYSDRFGQRIELTQTRDTGKRPEWFARLTGMHSAGLAQPIYIEETFHGTLSLEANAHDQENLLWQQTINYLSWGALTLVTLLWLLNLILHTNLTGLRNLRQAAQDFLNGSHPRKVLAPGNAAPELLMTVQVFNDLAEQQSSLLHELERQAREDTLTGLPNRRVLEASLAEACEDHSHAYAFCYIDLDQFKLVNDTCGHHAGDRMLRELIQTVSRYVGNKGLLCRIGGDEFGLLIENAALNHVLQTCDELIQLINVYRFKHEDRQFRLGASIGITLFGKGHPLLDMDEILIRADKACYAAKNQGRNRYQVYHGTDLGMQVLEKEMDWVAEIGAAMDEGRMLLYRQTIHPLRTGDPVHHEVLIRMKDRAGHIVNPGQFLPAAERFGIIQNIDRWVLDTTLEYLSQNPGSGDIYNINLSGVSFGDPGFLNHAIDAIGQMDVARQICFEITETAAITHLEDAQHFMRMLGGMGCKFALDDFGSGMSSFAYLRELPVHTLKISGDFVKNMTTNRHDYVFVATMTKLAHDLGLKCVGEFVQDLETLNSLRELNVDFAQGFYLHKPESICIHCRQLRYCTLPMSKNMKVVSLVAA